MKLYDERNKDQYYDGLTFNYHVKYDLEVWVMNKEYKLWEYFNIFLYPKTKMRMYGS